MFVPDLLGRGSHAASAADHTVVDFFAWFSSAAVTGPHQIRSLLFSSSREPVDQVVGSARDLRKVGYRFGPTC